MKFKIDYRSGVSSLQAGADEMSALSAEFDGSGAEMPQVETTFSGGEWDFAVYSAEQEHYPCFTTYFKVVK